MSNGKASRPDDMSHTGRLVVEQADDGDIHILVIDESGMTASIEFCVPWIGGGRSPRTHATLRLLIQAMRADAEDEDDGVRPETERTLRLMAEGVVTTDAILYRSRRTRSGSPNQS